MSFNTTLLTTLLLVSIVVVSFIVFALSVGSNYDFEVGEEYEDLFNQYAETEKEIDTYQKIIEGGEVNPEGSDQAVYKNVVVAGKQTMTATKTARLFVMDTFKALRLDLSIYGIIILMIVLLSVGGFIYMITGRRP